MDEQTNNSSGIGYDLSRIETMVNQIPDAVSPIAKTLLNSNDPPTLETLGLIRRACDDSLRDLTTMDSIIHALIHRRQELTGFVEAHLACASITRRLAPELLAQIFTFAVLDEDICDFNDPVICCNMNTILGLSHVSQKWRSIALDMGALWSTVQLVRLGQENLARLFLSRSKGHPITLQIGHDVSMWKTLDLGRILAIAWPHSNRWWRFRLEGLPMMLSNDLPVIKSLHGQFRNLEVLELELDRVMGDHLPPVISVFRDAPKLRRLDFGWSEYGIGAFPSVMQIPWDQLTVFRAGTCTPSIAIEALKKCCSLLEFRVRLTPELHPSVGNVNPTIIPNLVSLECVFGDTAIRIFDYVTLPKLKIVSLFNLSSDQFNIDALGISGIPGTTDSLGAFIARSLCTILSVKIVPVPYLVATTENILTHIPTLQELYLELTRQQALDPGHLLRHLLSISTSRNRSFFKSLPSLQTMTLWTFKVNHTFAEVVREQRLNVGPECPWNYLRLENVMEIDPGVKLMLAHIRSGPFRIALNGKKLVSDYQRFTL